MPGKASVIMACFNEEPTVEEIIKRVLSQEQTGELVIVDDGSTDRTKSLVEALALADPRIVLASHMSNRGKGAALRLALTMVTKPFVIIQDADLEYDPAEYPKLLAPLEAEIADVVFGSRFHGGDPHRVLYFWHYVGNRLLTICSNVFTNLNLSDMETCYKAFRLEVAQTLSIEENRFGFEPEFTAKVAAGSWRVYEVGISYAGRTYREGKKIGWRDGVRALYCILKYSEVGVWTRRVVAKVVQGGSS